MRFEPLTAFKLPFVGLLWEKFRSEYPNVEHAVPIMSDGNLMVDALTGAPLPRVWFINATDDELIQFQLDHFFYNWRRREQQYPRFASILPKFQHAKATLDTFLSEIGHSPAVVVEHHLSYVNHFLHGHEWTEITDLPKLLAGLATFGNFEFLPPPKNVAWNLRFDLPNELGTLDIKLSQQIRKSDQKSILALELSTKGKVPAVSWDQSLNWFNVAHEWIVNGFIDVTNPEIQQRLWEREDGC